MNQELENKLKKAGFPIHEYESGDYNMFGVCIKCLRRYEHCVPSLSELIEACGGYIMLHKGKEERSECCGAEAETHISKRKSPNKMGDYTNAGDTFSRVCSKCFRPFVPSKVKEGHEYCEYGICDRGSKFSSFSCTEYCKCQCHSPSQPIQEDKTYKGPRNLANILIERATGINPFPIQEEWAEELFELWNSAAPDDSAFLNIKILIRQTLQAQKEKILEIAEKEKCSIDHTKLIFRDVPMFCKTKNSILSDLQDRVRKI